MEKFTFESKGKTTLLARLEQAGLSPSETENFKALIDRIKFANIDVNSELGAIHIDMIASLLARQDNGDIFLQNILKAINHDWQEIEEFLISSTKEMEVENIDLDIGTNRRVDKIECVFNNNEVYDFTLSADLVDHKDVNNSNSYVEKEVFESPLAENNPALQKYFGYLERKMSGRNYRLIAKEFLPGKNISQYFNELQADSELVTDFSDVACELAYTMSYLYKRMNGQILEDLKLENVIYNYEDPNSDKLACRVCDHSGYFESNAEFKTISQIMAQLSSLLTIYSIKVGQLERNGITISENDGPEDLLINYLDSFMSDLDNPELQELFLTKVQELRATEAGQRSFDISDDLLDFVLNYLER